MRHSSFNWAAYSVFELGSVEKIRGLFFGFQKHLYAGTAG
jgi:hypothetical protein